MTDKASAPAILVGLVQRCRTRFASSSARCNRISICACRSPAAPSPGGARRQRGRFLAHARRRRIGRPREAEQNQPLIGALPLPPNFPFEYSVYQAGFDASWEIDLFGGKRRALEAATADWQGAIEARNDAMVSLLAEVARNYVELRGTSSAWTSRIATSSFSRRSWN
jgi:hypothetical protein